MVSKVILFLTIVKFAFTSGSNYVYYDSYNGEQISEEEYQEHVIKNTTFWCTNVFEPCDPDDWRRIDGSCNNLKHPNRGMQHTPTLKLLPPVYSGNCEEGYEPRLAKCGGPLPSERRLRTSLLLEGSIPDPVFTQLVPHFLVFVAAEVLSTHDTVNYVAWKPYCCLPQGEKDKECTPIKIPDDDPILRFGNLRCMKMTRPLSYQSVGCLKENSPPERIISSTPTIDLSSLYGSNPEVHAAKARLFKGGLLKYELENGKIWPPSTKTKENFCLLNQKPVETRCHDTPEASTNGIPGINFHSIWFWRLHNYIANALAEVNPCWDDDKLFYTARDINIAFVVQITYHELWPSLMGYDTLISQGVISPSLGFRDAYSEDELPQISAEYALVMRWFHILQENNQKMYDADGNYLKSIEITNITQRTGILPLDNNFDHITQGCFRQACAKFRSSTVNTGIAEYGLGPLTEGTDITTFDLAKNRYFGLPPYVKYLEMCNGRPFTSFSDLVGFIKPEMLEIIKDKYKHVEDIDLLAALWAELPAAGSFLPSTLHCLISDQLIRFLVSDRHWYERPNRPHAFTLEQLLQIRKATIARLLCYVGDTVTKIQPNAFLRPAPGNEMTSCKNLPELDFQAWKDPSCYEDSSIYEYNDGDSCNENPYAKAA